MKRNILIPVMFAANVFYAIAQQPAVISGSVYDAGSKLPLPGATIAWEGTTTGAFTDNTGSFELKVESLPVTLSVSFVGYNAQIITVSDSSPITIGLAETRNRLDEVVIVGYGTQSRKEFTGSAVQISGDDLREIPVQSFDQALSGRGAGVSISMPNGLLNNPPVIRIRGINSISLSSYPLIVVDGIPVNTGNISSNSIVPNNPLGDINPSDIESIDILKDAASTSIYGSRAAAGILLITTKRGRSGVTTANYESWVGFTRDTRFPDVLNAQQYIDLKNEAVLNSKILSGNAGNEDVASALYFPNFDASGSLIDTKWRDYIYQTGVSQNHVFSISGGSSSTNYYFSVNYSEQTGFLVGNEFDRTGARFNMDHEVNDWLSIRANTTYSISENKAFNSGSLPGATMSASGAGRLALVLPPNVRAYNENGNYNIDESALGRLDMGNNLLTIPLHNPVALFDLSRNTSQNDRFLGSLNVNFKISEQLQVDVTGAIDRLKNEDITFRSAALGSEAYNTQGSASNVSGLRNNYSLTNTVLFNNRYDRHNISALAGTDLQHFYTSVWGVNVSSASDVFFEHYQGGWGNITSGPGAIGERLFLSAFTRIKYDFDGKYFITGNFRRDGNSTLAAGSKFGNFGGVSAGWLLSQEDFIRNSLLDDLFENIKIIASWGRVGNGNLLHDYSSFDLYTSSLYGNSGSWVASQAGNPELSWETSEQTNLGFSVEFWDYRVYAELTYFQNDINRLILDTPQSPSKGIPGNVILTNIGSMYNRGTEFSINADLVRDHNFNWTASFNYINIKNKVTALAGDEDIVGYSGGSLNVTNVTRVGHSVGSIYGVISDGVNPENGRRIFINSSGERVQYSRTVAPGESNWTYLNGDVAPAIDGTDYEIIGNALPKWYGGFASNLGYRRFDLNLNFTYAGGHYLMNGTKTTLRDQIFFNNSTDMLRRWTTPGQDTDIPRLVYNDRISNGTQFPITENVEKGDFLRLQNVRLGYSVSSNVLNLARLSSLRVYGQITNAFILTNYTGTDPEISTNGNSNITPGVEFNSVGQGRTVTFGVNVGF